MTDNGAPSQLAAGRLHVNPGDNVASSWGNTVFDQSVNQFLSTADRDSQWPSPPDGALCYTAGEATLWARRSGTWTAVALSPAARGLLAYAETQTAQSGIVTTTADLTGLSITFTLATSRHVELVGDVAFTKAAADTAAWATLLISDGANNMQTQRFVDMLAPGNHGITVRRVLPLAAGTYTYKLRASTAAGYLNTYGTVSNVIWAMDVGP
jgi:hypothetical protein